jgi:hypothetical protein
MKAAGDARSQPAARVTAADLGVVLLLAVIGALGALPGSHATPDPVGLLCWLALWSLPAGWLCGSSRIALLPAAAAVPAIWMVALGIVDAASDRDLPSPAWAALAWTGLFALGVGLARGIGRARWSGAGVLFLGVLAASALPLVGEWTTRPFSPAARALAIDLSPATLLAECAGLDWLRHPVLYELAGTADIDPVLRSAWSASLAGPAVFLLGCAIAAVGDRIARRRHDSSDPR